MATKQCSESARERSCILAEQRFFEVDKRILIRRNVRHLTSQTRTERFGAAALAFLHLRIDQEIGLARSSLSTTRYCLLKPPCVPTGLSTLSAIGVTFHVTLRLPPYMLGRNLPLNCRIKEV